MSKFVQLKCVTDRACGWSHQLQEAMGSWAKHPAAGQFFVSFWKKMAILMPFGFYFARLQSHLKEQNFEI